MGFIVAFIVAVSFAAVVGSLRRRYELAREQRTRVYPPTAPLPPVPQAPYYPTSPYGPSPYLPTPSWGQVAGTLGGAWALHKAWENHEHSVYLRDEIAHAQDYAAAHAQFGTLDYYAAENEYLHHHH